MNYLLGKNRTQLELNCIDDLIDNENQTRIIDLMINELDIEKIGFKTGNNDSTGRARFNPRDLLKLFIYGYMNGYRSSRKLEKQTKINVEVIWLLKGLQPKHTVISDFRKNNIEAFEKMFRELVRTCEMNNLVGKETIAIDGTKMRANASRTRYYTERKLKIIGEFTQEKITEYIRKLDENDDADEKAETLKRIEQYENHKKKHEEIKKN